MEKTKIKTGNKSEKDFLEILSKFGWWAYRCPNTLTGQPCDIIAMREKENRLYDAKHCEGKVFAFSRIETNQFDTFNFATSKNIPCAFAIYFEKDQNWYVLPYGVVLECLNKGMKQITLDQLESYRLNLWK